MSAEKPATRSAAQAIRVTERASWNALAEHYQTVCGLHLRQLFEEDPRRAAQGPARTGDSDLGLLMAYESLRHYSQRDLTLRFVSNVNGTDFEEATRDLEPDETLFIICSKTFTPIETLTNAHTGCAGSLWRLGDDGAVRSHFVAVSANPEGVPKFGIDTVNMFGFADWTGGRYSMGSAIGLSNMIAIGLENFQALNPLADDHDLLMSNLFAQSEALAFGKTEDEDKVEDTPWWLAPHRVCDGNRPSNTLLAERLTPNTLGQWVALHEHSVFIQGTIWDINSFDQWGVELGKGLAERTAIELESSEEPPLTHDSSANTLIRRYRRLRAGCS